MNAMKRNHVKVANFEKNNFEQSEITSQKVAIGLYVYLLKNSRNSKKYTVQAEVVCD